MSRRDSTRTRRVSAQALRTLASFQPSYWIDSDNYTLNAGNVETWVDRATPGHTFAVAGTRVAEPATSAGVMNGKKFAQFAANTWYQSSAAASAWNFMSDGTGMTAFYVVRRLNVANHLFHATQAGAARTTGYDWNYDGTSTNLCLGNNATVNQTLLANNVDRCVTHTYDGTNGRTYSNGVLLQSAAQAPFAGAVEAMSIGADVNGAFSSTTYWAASLWFTRTMSPGEVAVVAGVLRRIYGTS